MNVKFNYQVEPFDVNVDNIGDFVLLEHARKCRTSKVSQLKKLLLGGEHFDAPIVINQNSEKRVIDGQHRILAIKKAIEINPDITVKVLLAKYKNLDEAEEREVFNRWNIGTKQSTDDFIKMHEKEIGIWKRIKDNFPVEVSIYRDKERLHLKLLLGAYLSAKDKKEGGWSASNKEFVVKAKELGKEDHKFLSDFVEQYTEVVGKTFDKSNVFMNTTPFNAVMYLFFHNHKEVDIGLFWETFRKRVMTNTEIMQLSLHGGITATKSVMNYMQVLMDPKREMGLTVPSQKDFLIFEEDEED